MSYANRLVFLKAESLELRRIHLDLILLYKILHGSVNIDAKKYFTYKETGTRGHTWSLVVQRSNTNIKKFSFAQRIVSFWNFLKQETVQLATVPAFKKSLHTVAFERFLRGDGLGV